MDDSALSGARDLTALPHGALDTGEATDPVASGVQSSDHPPDVAEKWIKFRRHVGREIGARSFTPWIKPLELIDVGPPIQIAAPTRFVRD